MTQEFPKPGEEIYGFTFLRGGSISMLGAETAEFIHKDSGAQLFYIQNDDRELGFSILFRTPQTDEEDSCHILEHLVLCSCPKYPSRDIFFDMDSKSYAAFMNGITDNTYTCYPVCSQSEEQLIRLADVFLSCMEEPDALKEPFFFLREGLRLELEDPEGPLSLHGTVFNEDWGHLTDLEENADSFTAQALYPNETASRLLGRAHLHYREVSWEKVREVFSKFYQYSNCLIVLYGQMNWRRVLDFLHREHLSRCPMPSPASSPRTQAMAFFSQPSVPGFRRIAGASPAPEGSPSENASILDYAIDLSSLSQEDLIFWNLTADILDNDASPLHQQARAAGIHNPLEVYVDTLLSKPSLRFRLHNGAPEQEKDFLAAVRQALSEAASRGLPEQLVSASLKEHRLCDGLAREGVHLGYQAAQDMGRFWSLTGDMGYFSLYERAFQAFCRDKSQSIIRRLAREALHPAASAFSVTSPSPGLAEAMEKEKNTYLRDTLASLSPDRRQALISRTREFYAWSSRDAANGDFLIRPSGLPAPEGPADFSVTRQDGLTLYLAPVSSSPLGSFQLYFDIRGLDWEDRKLLSLYQLLLTELDTRLHTSDEQKTLEQEYLHGCSFDEVFPGKNAGENSHPILSVFWYCLSEDFSQSLELLLDIMTGAAYENRERILQVLEKYLPDYDLAKPENAPSLASSLAESYIRQDAWFRYLLNSPEIYDFLKGIRERLTQEPSWICELAGKLKSLAVRTANRTNLVFLAAAGEASLPSIREQAARLLGKLPEAGDARNAGSLPPKVRRIGAVCDNPSLEIRMLGDFRGKPEFKGRYLPFLLALSDKYLRPAVRYQGQAYDSGIDFLLPDGYFSLWSCADGDGASTIPIFQNAGRALKALSISQEDLDGYILSAYAQALPPVGRLGRAMRSMRRHFAGIDEKALLDMAADIPRASLADQQDAAAVIQTLLENGPLAAAGSRSCLEAAQMYFDEIIRIRPGS